MRPQFALAAFQLEHRVEAVSWETTSGDALFLAPLGGAWRIDNGVRAHQMAAWYRLDISGVPAHQRWVYDLKRYAITNLLRATNGDPAAVATITGMDHCHGC